MSQFTPEQLQQAFSQIDQDGSGQISACELLALCKCVGADVSQQQVDAFLADHDMDGDGQIGLQEFTSCIESLCGCNQ